MFDLQRTPGCEVNVGGAEDELATPDRVLRLVSVEGDVLAEVPVEDEVTAVAIYLTDLDEPDEIFVALADQ